MHMAALKQYPATRNQENFVLVYDIGSDSSDVAILCIEQGFVEVMSVYGAPIAGNAFTSAIVEDVVAEFEAFHGVSLATDVATRARLFAACEKAKIALSTAAEATIEITALHGGVDWFSTITREQFEALLLTAWSGEEPPSRKTESSSGFRRASRMILLLQNPYCSVDH
jgi:molecular chaperone DnaK (HSP70)